MDSDSKLEPRRRVPSVTSLRDKSLDQPADCYISVPFQDWDENRMITEIEIFIEEGELEDYADYIRRGALLNYDRNIFSHERHDLMKLKPIEQRYLNLEYSPKRLDKFRQASGLYILVALCSVGAAVQGWDESAVNGAQVYYRHALGISSRNVGLVNSAPYLCCAASCLLTFPLNKYLGRRGVIFLTSLISCVTCIAQAFPQSWETLFLARFLLGFGIGPKSATIPIYAAECCPSNIRGGLVMFWQLWTAAGIMCGYIAGVALQNANAGTVVLGSGDSTLTCDNGASDLRSLRCSLNWRLMLASPGLLPIVVVLYIYTQPESPRWLLRQAHLGSRQYYEKAFLALCRLRHTKLQAARDLFLINYQIKEEERIRSVQKPFWELFTTPRNRRAMIASVTCMFFQQFCGVNVLAYYSTSVLLNANFSISSALLASTGFGIINFLFGLPALWLIDSFGRRSLLLATFPFMALFQLFIAVAFAATGGNKTSNESNTTQTTLVLLGMYLFAVAYSPGEGPVPFVYSAESMPIYNRDIGMGLVTAVTWFFNFLLSITWPSFVDAFGWSGAFGWYAAWCVIGEIVILLVVPETRNLSLEQLAEVFSISSRKHALFGLREASWFVRHYILRQKDLKKPILFHMNEQVSREGELEDVDYHGGVHRTFSIH
ncbi:hypothetical protein AAFC00_000174 [Neodothiora populina]|uniref:Major facilitator superfamily (MFS) profile domain-containing protein n=1 Tax=Neodothiora populina TaxID=2781224 RepID=A0ABR3P1M9_9PEZI